MAVYYFYKEEECEIFKNNLHKRLDKIVGKIGLSSLKKCGGIDGISFVVDEKDSQKLQNFAKNRLSLQEYSFENRYKLDAAYFENEIYISNPKKIAPIMKTLLDSRMFVANLKTDEADIVLTGDYSTGHTKVLLGYLNKNLENFPALGKRYKEQYETELKSLSPEEKNIAM